jgi:hypothetical protein
MTRSRRLAITMGMLKGLMSWAAAAADHRSGCHSSHSCPSDHGTYVCGDLGHCSECPRYQFCQGGQPRVRAQPPTTSREPPSTPPKPFPPPAQVFKPDFDPS